MFGLFGLFFFSSQTGYTQRDGGGGGGVNVVIIVGGAGVVVVVITNVFVVGVGRGVARTVSVVSVSAWSCVCNAVVMFCLAFVSFRLVSSQVGPFTTGGS
eukprot:m.89907 g.89907  ORF g.89907 m.89907 type:complete len:100 (-) comp26342_c0_seq1:937-1236(-)